MLEKLNRKFEALRDIDIGYILEKVFSDPQIQSDIVELNKYRLYERGLFGDGKPTGQYAESTKRKKRRAHLYGGDTKIDHRTFKDTGKTYDSIKMEATPDEIILYVEDAISAKYTLTGIFGKLLGLSSDDKKKIIRWIHPLVVQEIRKEIQRKTV